MSSDDSSVHKIVAKVKAEGVFDQFRKECVSFIEDSSQYRHLKDKVGQFVEDFLKDQPWPCPLEKKKLRELLKAQLHISKLLDRVDNIVIQAVRENCDTSLLPLTKPIVKQFFPSQTNKHHNNQKQTANEDKQIGGSEDGAVGEKKKVGVSDQSAQSQQVTADSKTVSKSIVSVETAVSGAPHKSSPKPIEINEPAGDHKQESHEREATALLSQGGHEAETHHVEIKDSQSTTKDAVCHDNNKHKLLNQSTGQEMAGHSINHLANVMDDHDTVQSEDKHSDDAPEENIMIKPSDEPDCEENSLENSDRPPLKRRRSSRSVALDESHERTDTISSRTRSKDTKLMKVLPPKKRARKF